MRVRLQPELIFVINFNISASDCLICFLVFCRQLTQLKDGNVLPPVDNLVRQLLEISNSENPPCANCDKRDRSNMHYCNTCGADTFYFCCFTLFNNIFIYFIRFVFMSLLFNSFGRIFILYNCKLYFFILHVNKLF